MRKRGWENRKLEMRFFLVDSCNERSQHESTKKSLDKLDFFFLSFDQVLDLKKAYSYEMYIWSNIIIY